MNSEHGKTMATETNLKKTTILRKIEKKTHPSGKTP